MKYLNQPLARTVIIAGAAIGAAAAIFSDQHPGLWLGLIGAWLLVAAISVYPIVKGAREK